MTAAEVDGFIVRLYKSGLSVREIYVTLANGYLSHKQIAGIIAQSQMTIEFNRSEFCDNYLIIPSIINIEFSLK